jgi:hypothetical protein
MRPIIERKRPCEEAGENAEKQGGKASPLPLLLAERSDGQPPITGGGRPDSSKRTSKPLCVKPFSPQKSSSRRSRKARSGRRVQEELSVGRQQRAFDPQKKDVTNIFGGKI